MSRKVESRNILIYGVGINDADYVVKKGRRGEERVMCPFYAKWLSMLLRCYGSPAYKLKAPTYAEAKVCEEWIRFSTFKAWMETQDWEGKQLDKDLLFNRNKIYSPETCVFITQAVNLFISTDRPKRDLPTGVVKSYNRPGFKSQTSFKGKIYGLGYFRDPDDAHEAWLKFKLEKAIELAEEIDDPKIKDALINRYKYYEK